MLSNSLVPIGSSTQQFISFGPILCLAYPEHFLHQNKTSPCLSTVLTKSRLPKWRLLRFPYIFDKNFGPSHLPGIFMCLLPFPHLIHRYLFVSSHHSDRCFILSLLLSTKLHFSFDYGLSSSQSFHSSTKQWKLAVYRKATYTSSLLLQSNSSLFCHKTFVQHCFCFCQLIRFLISFSDEPFDFCHLLFFFLRSVCLDMCHFLPLRCLF